MNIFRWYKKLPRRKKRGLIFFMLGLAFFLYGSLGLLGYIHLPQAGR